MAQKNKPHDAADDGYDDDIDLDEANEGDDDASDDDAVSGLDERIDRLEQHTTVMQLLTDPDVRAVIEAKKGGKRVKVIDDEGEPEPEPTLDLDEDLDDDDPTKAIVNKLVGKVGKLLEAKFTPYSERLATLEGLAQELRRSAAQTQVAGVRQKYPDLDRFRPAMLAILKDNPGLGPEQLYLLAKHQAGKLEITEASSFSEKPTQQPRKPRGRKREAALRGRAGWNKAMEKALGDLDLSSLE